MSLVRCVVRVDNTPPLLWSVQTQGDVHCTAPVFCSTGENDPHHEKMHGRLVEGLQSNMKYCWVELCLLLAPLLFLIL
jgi:hypothetical protein